MLHQVQLPSQVTGALKKSATMLHRPYLYKQHFLRQGECASQRSSRGVAQVVNCIAIV